MKSNNKTLRFLKLSLAGICILCLCVFVFLASYANKKGTETVGKVSSLYMGGLSERIQLHFGILAEYHLSHVQDVVDSVPAAGDSGLIRERLAALAEARNFHYLAICADDGSMEMLYGPSIRITDPEPFLGSLRSGSQKVAVGVGSNGSDLVLLGVPGAYPLSSGGQGIALVAAVPVDDFTDLLFLSEESSPVYSHIIRVDGTYVIRSSKDVQENYLEHIQLIYDEKRSGEASQIGRAHV